MKISDMRNLGPASEKMLKKIGITESEQLKELGPDKAFIMLEDKGLKPHTSFLYALIGACTDRSWNDVVKDFRAAGMLKGQQNNRSLKKY